MNDFHICAVDTIGHPGKSTEVSLSARKAEQIWFFIFFGIFHLHRIWGLLIESLTLHFGRRGVWAGMLTIKEEIK